MTNQEISEEMIRLYPNMFKSYFEVLTFFVVGMLSDLINKGVVEGPYELSVDGELIFSRMKELCFKPTEDEFRNAFNALQNSLPEEE